MCPGSCHHVRNDLRARQRDSGKYSIFIKVRVHTHEGGEDGRTEEVSHLEVGFLSIMSKGGYGGGSCSLRLLISVTPPPVMALFLESGAASKPGCRSMWLSTLARTVLTCLNYFIPQKIGKVAKGGQVYSHKSCLQCPNLEREGRGSPFRVLTVLPHSPFIAA